MTGFQRRIVSIVITVIMIVASAAFCLNISAVGKVASVKVSSTTQSSVALKWSKTSGAKSYLVYRYDTSAKKWTRIKNTTATNYTDSSLSSGKKHYYCVKAVATENGKTVTGDVSDVVIGVTQPGTVSGVKATSVGSDKVTLSWNKVAGVKGYAVCRYDTVNKKYVILKHTAGTSYTVSNLTPATSYIFSIRSFVNYGSPVYSPYSARITVNTKAPSVGAVKNLRLASVNATGFRLQWDQVSSITGYQVCQLDSVSGKLLGTSYTTKNYIDINVGSTDKNYVYRVRAYVKAAGNAYFGSYSGKITAFTKPSVPTGLEGAENSSSGISLKWNAVNGASGYEVYSYDASDGKWVYVGYSTKETYNVKGLKETSHYKYRIRAYKSSGSNKFYSDFCESVTVAYTSGKNSSIYSEEMEKSGVFGYLYDPSEKCFYTAADPWQRNVGYNSIFDTAAPLSLINFDTLRLRFEYDNKDWMIQLWKGQYGLIFYGAEVGVYTKPKDRTIMHYDCASDDEMLKMSMDFLEYKRGTWSKRFSRPYGYYWWCTGFVPGNKFGDFSGIGLDMRITAKDYTMLNALKGALDKNKITYTTKGLDVYFSYR